MFQGGTVFSEQNLLRILKFIDVSLSDIIGLFLFIVSFVLMSIPTGESYDL